MNTLRNDAEKIYTHAINCSLPDAAVKNCLESMELPGNVVLISVGKAAWTMASAALEMLDRRVSSGLVLTKYDHSRGPLGNLEIIEAGHPILDENTFYGTNGRWN